MEKYISPEIAEKTKEATDTVKAIGVTLMTAAAVAESIGIHAPKHEKAVLVPAESGVQVVDVQKDLTATAQRREREEHTPHYTSYSASQRTPSRTGKA